MKKLFEIQNYELLSRKVYRVLKSRIVKGDFKPGEKLWESRIAKQLGVSRTPVREALRLLASAGFVKMSPNQAIIVNEFSAKDIQEVIQIRGALEGLAASLAADFITENEIKELENYNQIMEQFVKEKNISDFIKESNKFHELILNICRNDHLVHFRKNLSDQIYRFRNMSLNIPGRLSSALKEHKEITEALKQKDAEKAEKLSKQHIANELENILSSYEEKNIRE